jgi:two-component system, chemotaxis family, chemotaxis protein CheY
MSILVIDDNPAVRTMLADILHDEGYQVVCAANGAEALVILRGHPHPIRLILLDLDMPVMNGKEFRQLQIQEPVFAAIPVVVISAEPEVAHQVDSVGVADYIPKPVVYDTLLDTVKYHYARSG